MRNFIKIFFISTTLIGCMSNGNYLDNIKNKCKIYNSDSFTINLSDDEIENNKFEKIDDKFYLEYVENNSLLRKRNETKDNTWGANHYYYGVSENDNFYFVFIFESFHLDIAENKIFLFVLDKSSNLIETKLVSELTHFSGAEQKIQSEFKVNTLTVSNILDAIDGSKYNEETKEINYTRDSVVEKFDCSQWKNIERISKDSIRSEFWN